MIKIKCPACTVEFEAEEGKEYVVCEYCGTRINLNTPQAAAEEPAPKEAPAAEEEPAPKAAAFGSEDDEDDGLLSLEDDEDPVPVEMPGQAGKTAENPFSAFDKTETKDAITILDLDD